jgi:hypothetical protein
MLLELLFHKAVKLAEVLLRLQKARAFLQFFLLALLVPLHLLGLNELLNCFVGLFGVLS